MMNPAFRISIAGHRGLVGSAILRYRGFIFEPERPEYVFPAAAKVGRRPGGVSFWGLWPR